MICDALRMLLGEQKVMCVPEHLIRPALDGDKDKGYYQADDDDRLTCRLGNILDHNLTAILHFQAETDTSTRQIVPCIIVEDITTGCLLVTRRLIGQSQMRDAFSLQVGDHLLHNETILEGKTRIVKEYMHLGEDDLILDDFCGFVHCSSSPHDSTHLGLVFHVGIIGSESVKLHRDLIGDWLTLEKIARLYKTDSLEPWSQLLFEKEVLAYLAASREYLLQKGEWAGKLVLWNCSRRLSYRPCIAL